MSLRVSAAVGSRCSLSAQAMLSKGTGLSQEALVWIFCPALSSLYNFWQVTTTTQKLGMMGEPAPGAVERTPRRAHKMQGSLPATGHLPAHRSPKPDTQETLGSLRPGPC